MSQNNAEVNLQEFSKDLNLKDLAFDANLTCILGIDDAFSLHLTYEPNSDRLYLYCPILDGLPQDEATRLKLYEALLESSMLGAQMAGGGAGVAIKEGLILMHATLDMNAAEPTSLRRFSPVFVEAVERWRKKAKDIVDGNDPGATGVPGGKAPETSSFRRDPKELGVKGGGFMKI